VSEFEHFPNIEVLWLNNNLLESLENLDKNYKIKHLYL
jgi:Leucine-rich repeat (LRR) protein